MSKKGLRLTVLAWGIMIVEMVLLTMWPAAHYITQQNLWGWWLALGCLTLSLLLGIWWKKQRRGLVILSLSIAVAVLFSLFTLLVGLFSETGLTRYAVGLLALLGIICDIWWYGTVYERRNRLVKQFPFDKTD
ncbi:hypothetical protein [Furfurilactobacillus entadae]|uniref:hypothetical protein n=1 Tax=Furfurilactobacillus entadae TaxID=2922307 RepID=UPI0035E9CB98